MSDEYTREDLDDDLSLMVRAGLLDISMREDGVWLYSITEKAAKMTDQEKAEAIFAQIEKDSNE